MNVPLNIAFHNMDVSEAVAARVAARAGKLAKLYNRLVRCRVVIEASNRTNEMGKTYRVHIDLSVPGGNLVVDRAPGQSDADLYLILSNAFDTAARRLKEYKARLRQPQDKVFATA